MKIFRFLYLKVRGFLIKGCIVVLNYNFCGVMICLYRKGYMRFIVKIVMGLMKVRYRNEVGVIFVFFFFLVKRVFFLVFCQIDIKEMLDDDILEVDVDFFLKVIFLDKYVFYVVLKEGVKVFFLIMLVLNRDDLKNLVDEFGILLFKNKIFDCLDLNLIEFCVYYDYFVIVWIKFINIVK